MESQRNDIGDRAAPAGAPESTQAPDPSTPAGGGVEQPGGDAEQGRIGQPQLRLVPPKLEAPKCQSVNPPRRPRYEIPSLASVVENQHRQLRNHVALVANGTEVGLLVGGPGGTGKSYVTRAELEQHRAKPYWFSGKLTPL